ncbi:MAG: M48 family metallopeptidase [Candidatus Muirbacterium halophilum]|nr:M48 family metallopeptidase [Candidatus Muirbacterium halophilum]MCK9476663.1 M48 family metallopeptidase [Candidatus Muirbacterium halophilum]
MIDYKIDIVYKKVKYINIKVKPDMRVILTAPFKVDSNRVNKFIFKKNLWIKEKLAWFKENSPVKTVKNYVSGESFEYLGKNYRLKVIKDNIEDVKLINGYLTIFTLKIDDRIYKESLVYKWYYEHAKIIFNDLLVYWSEKTDLYPSLFRIKKMKTRWGSCNTKKRYINLNLELIKKEKYCIEYVVLHELVHLKHNHHQKNFYNHLALYMPDWKIRKQKLNI